MRMRNQMEQVKVNNKITVNSFLQWILGVCSIFTGFVVFSSSFTTKPLSYLFIGYFEMIGGVVLCPWTYHKLSQWDNVELSNGLRWFIFIFCILIVPLLAFSYSTK